MNSLCDAEEVLARIATLPDEWHKAGMMPLNALRAIARHAEAGGPVLRSVETGAGLTTLLFSHLSANHTYFAINAGDSLRAVASSPLLKADTVTLVEGPTQRTLPEYRFTEKLQVVLLDGPHAYPFPDLEYYYLYPHVAEGGLLIVDDIKVPSIHRMFDILRADAMYRLVEVVGGNTAFFRRSSAPLLDPEGDGWWTQGYNRAYFEKLTRMAALGRRVPAWGRRLAAWGMGVVGRK
jgi:hypothetical protein